MNNISQDKEKLLKLLEELEEEYQAGNISDDKYNYLSKQYEDRLSDIVAVDKIRAMQGKKIVEKPVIYSKKLTDEKSKEEDEELIDKYVIDTKKEEKELKAFNKRIIAVIAIVCLAVAFIAGIGFGIFNFDFPSTQNTVVTVNETAFPIVKSNGTNKTNQTNPVKKPGNLNKNLKSDSDKNSKPDSDNKINTNKKKDSNTNKRPNKKNVIIKHGFNY